MSDDLRHAVRASIEEQVADFDPPVPHPHELPATLRAVRARKRRHDRRLVAAGLAAALALGAPLYAVPMGYAVLDVATGLVTGTREQAHDDGPSALDTGVVRGSLAGDQAWLLALREHVVSQRRGAVMGQGLRPQSVDDVHVLYAADVDRWRVALVEVAGAPSLGGGGRQHVWYSNARGSAAQDMLDNGSTLTASLPAVGNEVSTWLTGTDGTNGPSRPPVERAAYIVVSAGSEPPLVAETPRIARNGAVVWPTRRLQPDAEGVYEEVLTPGWGTFWVYNDLGPPWWTQVKIGEPVPEPALAQGLLEDPVHPSYGSGPALQGQVTRALAGIRFRYGLDVATLPRRVLWTGRANGYTLALVAVTAPSGAHVVNITTWNEEYGDLSGVGDVAAVPAGPLEDVALAWSQFSLTGETQDVQVLAPRRTATVRLALGERVLGQVRTTRSGVISVPHEPRDDYTGATVTMLDAEGDTIATVEVDGRIDRDPMPPRPQGAD